MRFESGSGIIKAGHRRSRWGPEGRRNGTVSLIPFKTFR